MSSTIERSWCPSCLEFTVTDLNHGLAGTPMAHTGYALEARDDLLTFVNAFRRAVETEYWDGREPPLWLRNSYEDARELCQLTPDVWPAPWEREA